MRRDPSEIVRERLNDLLWRSRLDTEDVRRRRDAAFGEILDSYEGYDIIEVICREAEFSTLSASLEKDDHPLDDAQLTSAFFDALPTAAKKYAESLDWPETETRQAKSFFLQLIEHSMKAGD